MISYGGLDTDSRVVFRPKPIYFHFIKCPHCIVVFMMVFITYFSYFLHLYATRIEYFSHNFCIFYVSQPAEVMPKRVNPGNLIDTPRI